MLALGSPWVMTQVDRSVPIVDATASCRFNAARIDCSCSRTGVTKSSVKGPLR